MPSSGISKSCFQETALSPVVLGAPHHALPHGGLLSWGQAAADLPGPMRQLLVSLSHVWSHKLPASRVCPVLTGNSTNPPQPHSWYLSGAGHRAEMVTHMVVGPL